MQRDGFYGNGQGGFPLMDASGPSSYGTPALRAPQGYHQDLTSYETGTSTQSQTQTEAQTKSQSQHHDGELVQPSPPPSNRAPVVAPSSGGDANRSQLDMPPVVGSTIQYSNKPLKHRPIPDDVEEIRDKLFHLQQDVLLDSQQIADYWPHMSNVWIRSTKPSLEDNGVVVEMYECRNRRRVKRVGQERQSAGTRNRANKDDLLGDAEPCKLRVRVQSYTKHAEGLGEPCRIGFMSCKCIPEWVYICRTTATKEKNHVHQHEISLSDRYKRSDAILYFCKLKVAEHYSYPAVLKWLKEKYGHITHQVNCVTKQDVANVARPWRLLNKDVELRQQIEEETDLEQQRRQYLDSISATSAAQLAKALVAVCTHLPQAIDLVLPFLDKATHSEARPTPIKEGADIVIPPPGCPVAKQYSGNYKGVLLTPEEVAERTGSQRVDNSRQPAAAVQPPLAPPPPPPPQPQQQQQQHVSPYTAVPNPQGGPVRNQPHLPLQKQPDPHRPGQFVPAPTSSSQIPAPGTQQKSPAPYAAPARVNVDAPTPQNGGLRTPHRAMATTWLTSSVSSPVVHTNQPTVVAQESTATWRPSWALPAAKRPAIGDIEKPEPKRQLVDDIETQLRRELG